MTDPLALPDWRRCITDMYAAVRAEPDPVQAHSDWRQIKDQLFRDHSGTPLTDAQRANFAGLSYYPYDPAFRFVIDVEPADGELITADVGKDGQMAFRPVGVTRGLKDALGGELTLYWIDGYGGGLFLPFRDGTTGTGTYGGGRYLIDTIKSADLGQQNGRLILDFNFAYNPSCSYSDAWVCPLSPPENIVPVSIEAGERAPVLRPPVEAMSEVVDSADDTPITRPSGTHVLGIIGVCGPCEGMPVGQA